MTNKEKRDLIENIILLIIFLLLLPVMVCWELAKGTNKPAKRSQGVFLLAGS